MAEHAAWSAPDMTALYDTSIKKKCTNGIGGRTCTNSQDSSAILPFKRLDFTLDYCFDLCQGAAQTQSLLTTAAARLG